MNRKFLTRVVPILLFFAAAIVLLLRARYSFCWSDESFYASTTYRFLNGDCIFVDEWFPTQLVSIILLPFHYVFLLITGSNNGIILYFRIIYVIFSLIITICIYMLLKKHYDVYTGFAAGLFYQFYCHLNIATMSYYTLSMSFMLISMLLIYDAIKDSENNIPKLIGAGALFALAVLSLPSLAVFYFLAAATLFAFSFKNKTCRTIFIFTLLGILIPAVLVLIYVLPTSGLTGIINNLGYVLSDEEHTTSLVYPFKNFFISVYDVFGKKRVFMSLGLAFLCFFTSASKDVLVKGAYGKYEVYRRIIVAISYALLAFNFVLFAYNARNAWGHTGFIATAFLMFAMPVFFLTPHQKRNYLVFLLLFVFGMIFSMTYSYSSLCDLYVLSIGHQIAAVGGICFVSDYIKEVLSQRQHTYHKYISISLCVLALAVLLSETVYLRFVNVYRDAPMSTLTEKITDGPASGLYTTKDHRDSYGKILKVIDEYADGSNSEYVFFTKILPWGYLRTNMRCGALTTWRTGLDSERFSMYRDIFPDKKPSVVIVLNEDIAAYETCGDVVADPTPNANKFSGSFYEMLNSEYTQSKSTIGNIYTINR